MSNLAYIVEAIAREGEDEIPPVESRPAPSLPPRIPPPAPIPPDVYSRIYINAGMAPAVDCVWYNGR